MATVVKAGRGTVTRDYEELFRDLNQISDRIRLDQMELSEVMVVHRMFIRLQELDLGHVEGAEKVKHLYVFADVVEVEEGGNSAVWAPLARLPGSITVVILCRVVSVAGILLMGSSTFNNAMRIQLPHMKLRAVEITTQSPAKLQMHRRDAALADEQYPALCIHASVIQCSNIRSAVPVNLQRFPVSLQFFSYMPDRESNEVVLSSASRQLVDEPVDSFNVHTLAPEYIKGVPIPEVATIDSASLSENSYSVQISRLNLSLSNSIAAEGELEPAFSLLKPKVPFTVLIDPNILLAMQTSVLIVELVELAHPSADTRDAVTKHKEWINQLLLQATSANGEGTNASLDEHRALLFRVQYLMKRIPGREDSLVIPRLQYDVYSSLINRMAQVAESYDQSLRQLKLFISQNRILGSYLLQQNQAFAEKERDMDVFHSELLSQRKLELEDTIHRMGLLGSQMETQQREMEQARADMEAGLREFRERQLARAMFSVLGAVAAVGLAFLTGGATAPAAVRAAHTAVSVTSSIRRMFETVMQVLDGIQAVMEWVVLIKELVSNIQDLNKLVEAPEMSEPVPTQADWDIFVNEIEAVAEQMPTEVSEVSTWKAKCKNVAALGREMTTMAVYISELQYEIKVQSMLQEIARSHADRLSNIQAANLRSYTEMVTQMDMRTTRMLVSLLEVLRIQNAALMYQFLSPPTLMDAWPVTMETVWRILVQHEHTAILGLMRLGPSFDFMRTYVVEGIPVDLLLDGEDWEFEIPVEDYITFPPTWSRVRIHHLEITFVQGADVHQPMTETGKVYILLQGSRIFHDRNQDDAILYEAATPLDYHYAYRLDTRETTLSNLPSHDFTRTFMRMTPFTNWRLRLSASAEENKGLRFPTATSADSTTQIAISFHVSAIRRVSL